MRTPPLLVSIVLPLLVLAACGQPDQPDPPASTSYDGPLHLPEGEGRHPRAGAAGDVVDCEAWGTGSSFRGDVYVEGATADTAAGAARTAASEGLWPLEAGDVVRAAESEDRVLYVVEVAGVPKAALIVRDGLGAEGTGGNGWYAESWATCDIVELPADIVERLGREVWTDAGGRIVPTRRLQVFRGAEHCGWQHLTLVSLGRYPEGPTFIRGPVREPALRDLVAEPYLTRTTLPADAVDSGFHRGRDRLWLAADRSRAYLGAGPDAVELLPRLVEPLGCG
ncbi:hypothetical protein [Nocardioides pantholopis]|uniref:hypothetical protein n=1 Tax=Nocardioides pantholopis TaxID=2483798 RepID=UPI000FD879F6|nr:hypothetical protein [Nocardioides pantholopis]